MQLPFGSFLSVLEFMTRPSVFPPAVARELCDLVYASVLDPASFVFSSSSPLWEYYEALA